MEINPRLTAAIIQVVDTQIETNDPVETAQTLVRLVKEGHNLEEAKELIGCVVMAEVFDVLSQGEPFDHERYVKALNKLPEIPNSPGENNG